MVALCSTLSGQIRSSGGIQRVVVAAASGWGAMKGTTTSFLGWASGTRRRAKCRSDTRLSHGGVGAASCAILHAKAQPFCPFHIRFDKNALILFIAGGTTHASVSCLFWSS
jgi:hypothetical protein